MAKSEERLHSVCLSIFTHLIKCLLVAGKIIPELNENLREANQLYQDLGKNPLSHAFKVIYRYDLNLMWELEREIEEVLERNSENANIYGKQLIGEFSLVHSFLVPILNNAWQTDINIAKEAYCRDFLWFDLKIGGDDELPASSYIQACQKLMESFLVNMDINFLSYDVDLLEIQRNLGFFLFAHRPLGLHEIAYNRKLEKEETKKSREENKKEKIIKPFQDHFIPNNKNELASLCLKIFNNDSEKTVAIMLCLLANEGLINILDKRKAGFYKSWYRFIEKQPPTNNNNFYAINKYSITHKDGRIEFKNEETDTDFNRFKKIFDEELRKIEKLNN